MPHLDAAVDFIHTSIAGGNGDVLVHCASGISRSGSIAIAYMLRQGNYASYDDAWQAARDRRSVIHPNSGFAQQLRHYAEQCQKRKGLG